MGWFRVGTIASGAKVHLATDATAELLAEDLSLRFRGPFPLERVEGVPFFEIGRIGMVIADQPSIVVRTCNNPIEFDCRQVEDILEDLKVPAVREFSDGTKYIKLYNSHNCIVLSEEERVDLLNELEDVAEESTQVYEEFYDNWKQRVLNKDNL